MTAGTGIQHSEYNHEEKPLRFVQVWINPRARGIPPNYGSYDAAAQTANNVNTLQYLASDTLNEKASTPVKLNQDVDCYAAEFQKGKSVSIDVPKGRQAYLLCVEGTLAINGKKRLERHDAAEIVGGQGGDNGQIDIEAIEVEDTENGPVAHFLVFVMKHVPGSGRKDIEAVAMQ